MRTHVHHLVSEGAERHPGAPALTHDDTTVSYGELWRLVAAFGSALHGLGLRRGERVAIHLDKRIETVVAMFGASAAGGAFVPINPLLKARQVAHILRDCSVRVLVTTPERLDLLGELHGVEHVILVGEGWDGLLAASAGELPDHGVLDVDMAAILYTSGSTGLPKGVVLSHRNLLAGAESVATYLGNDASDVILAALPLSFDAGLSQVTTALHAGAHVVLVNYLLPRDIVKLCARHGVTGLTCVPPLWIALAETLWPAEATGSLRYFANTGGRMPRATLDRLRAIFPAAKPFLMYGLTEAFRSTYLDPAEVDRRPDSIGKAIPGAEILVVREDGSPCAPGEPGELVHRGALVALGYWNDPERTAERFKPVPGRDGALCTPEMAVWSGDIVVADEDGFLSFVSRKDEMIKTSGYRVSPTEIEEAAYETGLVRDAVALGVEDDRVGQVVALVVSGDVDPAELRGVLARQLPGYMVPRTVHVRGELPRSPNGKFDRALLAEDFVFGRDQVAERPGRTRGVAR